MKEKTVLVIDDSATIRRFVDGELSSNGYRVVMAPTAEDGIVKASEENPDLILLDHQLPGTTGYEVCLELLKDPELAKIPVVASSTLRKKAYAEYVDCDNVVDMLPKPYKPEALIATVANAIDTAEMVVQSQSQGSAVPEVIDELGDSDLAGTFRCFGLRELLDMLNNGAKSGSLEVETSHCRVFIYVQRGRIQGVTASGVNADAVAKYMPASLSELAPVIKFTLSGRRGSEVDGLVDLLNTKVLDPRLLKKLLRLQAAVLLRTCFRGELKSFRFDHGQAAPSLFEKLPLDCSLLSLLVEGAMTCEESELPAREPQVGFTRRAIRGQNLDRAGLSSRHMKLMSALSEVVTVAQLAKKLGWEEEEVQRVLHGFELAELIEQQEIQNRAKVAVVSGDQGLNQKLASFFSTHTERCAGKLVKDWTAANLLLRRYRPQFLLVEVSNDDACEQLARFKNDPGGLLNNVRVIGIRTGAQGMSEAAQGLFDIVLNPCFEDDQLLKVLTSDSGSTLVTSQLPLESLVSQAATHTEA